MELALILRVSRSQVSLYELGKRNLPTQASLKLAELLQATANTTAKPQPEGDHFELRGYIEKLIADNEFALMTLERKYKKALAKTHQLDRRSALTRHFMDNKSSIPGSPLPRFVQGPERDLLQLSKMELKIELIQNELAFLRKRL